MPDSATVLLPITMTSLLITQPAVRH